MTALVLGVFVATLVLHTAPRLVRAEWVRRAPGLGILAWQMLVYATVLSMGLVGLTWMLHWDSTHAIICIAWRHCLDALRGDHGPRVQLVAVLGAVLLMVMASRLLVAAYRLARTEHRQRRLLLTMIRLVGSRLPALGATVVPSARPAACLVPGGGAEVVVTSAAVLRLSPAELRAVLAHERAHACGHHYWLLRSVRLLDRAFPWLPMFGLAAQQVRRLVELRADEIASRSTQPQTLARALVTLATAWPGQHPAAGGMLAADGGDTAERLDRLLQPPQPLPRAMAYGLAVLLPLLPLLPVGIALVDRYVAFG